MIFKWLKKTHSKNSADNNINITTSTDIMYDIGVSLGEIKSYVKSNETRINFLEKKIDEHHKRIKKLETIKNKDYAKKA